MAPYSLENNELRLTCNSNNESDIFEAIENFTNLLVENNINFESQFFLKHDKRTSAFIFSTIELKERIFLIDNINRKLNEINIKNLESIPANFNHRDVFVHDLKQTFFENVNPHLSVTSKLSNEIKESVNGINHIHFHRNLHPRNRTLLSPKSMIVSFDTLELANQFRLSTTNLPSGSIPKNRKLINVNIKLQICPTCQRTNHSNPSSQLCDRTPRCPRCWSPDHTSPTLDCPETCWDCGEGHISSSTRCPINRAYIRKERIERRNAFNAKSNSIDSEIINSLKNEINILKESDNAKNIEIQSLKEQLAEIKEEFVNLKNNFLITPMPSPFRSFTPEIESDSELDSTLTQTESQPNTPVKQTIPETSSDVNASPKTPTRTPDIETSQELPNSPNYDSNATPDFFEVFNLTEEDLRTPAPRSKPTPQTITTLKKSLKQTLKYPPTIMVIIGHQKS